jgi:hemin uptake protein HemP
MQGDGSRVQGKTTVAAGANRPAPSPRVTSQALLGSARELIIEHDGREYRLRLTQQGKLILTA